MALRYTLQIEGFDIIETVQHATYVKKHMKHSLSLRPSPEHWAIVSASIMIQLQRNFPGLRRQGLLDKSEVNVICQYIDLAQWERWGLAESGVFQHIYLQTTRKTEASPQIPIGAPQIFQLFVPGRTGQAGPSRQISHHTFGHAELMWANYMGWQHQLPYLGCCNERAIVPQSPW